MGARAQVKIEMDPHPVYLYTHYGSGEILRSVQTGMIAGQGRWSDDEYLTRILFDNMRTKYDHPETGYGIGTGIHGDLDCHVVVDCESSTVAFHQHQEDDPEVTWTFEDFIQQDFGSRS